MVVVLVGVFVEGSFSACCEAALAGIGYSVVLSVSMIGYVVAGLGCVGWVCGSGVCFIGFCGCPVIDNCG